MILFCDTSALIKNYIQEAGSERVEQILDEADEVFVSALTLIECFSTLRRILLENSITREQYEQIKREIQQDFSFFSMIDFSEAVPYCEEIIDLYQLKTLDSFQLASALAVKGEIDYFLGADTRLNKAAEAESIRVLNPLQE